METILTYQYRIKDSSTKKLLAILASNVNFIWNFSNELIRKRYKESRQTTNESLLSKLTKGATKEEEILIKRETKLDLSIREWVCSECNSSLNRDTNAAKNHLRFGSETLNLEGLRSPRL